MGDYRLQRSFKGWARKSSYHGEHEVHREIQKKNLRVLCDLHSLNLEKPITLDTSVFIQYCKDDYFWPVKILYLDNQAGQAAKSVFV